MNNIYLGVSGSGKTYKFKHMVLDYLSLNKPIYVIGRSEEWSCFNNIVLFDSRNISSKDINNLLDVSNSIIFIDSTELLIDKGFIRSLFVTSRVKNNTIYLSSFGVEYLDDNILTNVNSVHIGYLPLSSLECVKYRFNVDIDNYDCSLSNYKFIEII